MQNTTKNGLIYYVTFGNRRNLTTGASDLKSFDQNDLFDAILETTEYDFRSKPEFSDGGPVNVLTSVYMYFLGHIDDERLEFETILNIRHRWSDPR